LACSSTIAKALKNHKDIHIQQLLQHLVLLQNEKERLDKQIDELEKNDEEIEQDNKINLEETATQPTSTSNSNSSNATSKTKILQVQLISFSFKNIPLLLSHSKYFVP